MTIRILCIGKLKEHFYKDAVAEFVKRLSRYADVTITELEDLPIPRGASEADRSKIRIAESRQLLQKVDDSEVLIATDLAGEHLSSEQLASKISDLTAHGRSRITFAVGGSLGLSQDVLKRADMRVCFGRPTFSHQIFRVMLLEQIYRSFKIINNEPYHK